METLSRKLVRLTLRRRRQGLPAEVRAKASMHIADAVGIALAALKTTTLAREAIAAVSAGEASGRCSLIGDAAKLPPAMAAFANSALIHILDFDDIHDIARLHPSSVTLPAALAAAEMSGAPGEAVVDGVALGNELMCRLGLVWNPTGTGPVSDWFTTQLFGYMGAVVSAGVVLNLGEDQLASAFGLAYMQAAGGKEAGFGVGATARAIYPASWLFRDTEIKPWPSCRLSHPYIAAAQALRKQLGGDLRETVKSMDVAVNASAAKLCHPLEQRRRPQTLQDAKYSVPYMTAFALSNDVLDLSTINDGMLGDAGLQALADRIAIHETLPDTPGHPPAEIVIRTTDGRTLEMRDKWQSMLPEEAVWRKFNACLEQAGVAGADPAWQRLNALDAEKDVGALLASLR